MGAGDDLSLLLKIRGDSAGGKQAVHETRAAIVSLRSQMGSEFGQMQNAANSVFSNLSDNVNVFVGQRLPLLGGGFLRVTENLKGFGAESTKNAAQLANLNKTIDGLAASTGKSRSAITSFLTQFVQLETQAKRDAAAIETFGVGIAQTLIPQLEKAGEEMVTVAGATEGVGASMAGAVPIIGVVVVAVAALTVAAIAVTREFFSLVHATAEWQGKLFDLSQQTGVSVETLNALEIAAGKTGGSIESISQALVIYQGKLEEAQDASSDTGKKFAELGISTDNTEDSLRSAFAALAKMPEGFHQTNEAAELFGRRGGKQVLAIIKETNGDIDSAVTKLGALARVTTAEAAAADEFNDALKDVSTSMRGLTALVVRDSIPQILSGLRAVSQLATKVLSENKEAISAISTAIGVFVRGNLVILLGGLNSIQLALNGVNNTWLGVKSLLLAGITGRISIVMEIFRAFKGQQEALAGLRGADAGIQGESPFQGLGGGITEPTKGSGGGRGRGGGGAKTDPAVALLERLQQELLSLTDKTKEASIAQELLEAKYAKSNPTLLALIKSTAELIDIRKASIENQKEADEQLEIAQDQLKRETEAVTDFLNDQQQELVELSRSTDTAQNAVDDFRVAFIRLGGVLGDDQLTLMRYNATMIDMGEAMRKAGKEDAETLIEILKRLGAEADKVKDKIRRAIEEAAKKAADAGGWQTNLKRSQSPIDDLFKHFNKSNQTAMLVGLNALTEAFAALGAAAASALQSFILYGSAGTSVRKFAAEVIAAVAQMAVVKAVWELAEGFAAIAKAWMGIPTAPGEAAAHFKSAALYGAVAGVAAITGRAVAGNAFQSATGGGGGNGGSGSGSSGGGNAGGNNGSSAPITLGSQRPAVVIHKFIPPPGYGEQIVIAALDSNHPEVRRLLAREDR